MNFKKKGKKKQNFVFLFWRHHGQQARWPLISAFSHVAVTQSIVYCAIAWFPPAARIEVALAMAQT